MFNQGDHIMYSNYGVCFIDEVKEKTTNEEKRLFYILHPINETNSKIITPVDNQKVKIRAIMEQDKAKKILDTLTDCNVHRIADKKVRDQEYTRCLKEGDPHELVIIINALMIEDKERKIAGKKISATDKKYLEKAERLLYPELSIALNIDMEQMQDRIACRFEEVLAGMEN